MRPTCKDEYPMYIAIIQFQSVVQGTPMSSGEGRKVRDKPFQCTLCHKRYTNRAGLTVHILSHTG